MNGDLSVSISDEHIERLDIKADTLLLVRVPINTTDKDIIKALRKVRSIVKAKTGNDPGLVVVPRSTDLSLLNNDSLEELKDEIDVVIDFNKTQNGEIKPN